MEDLSLHVLDVTENALMAGADHIQIRVIDEPKEDFLRIEIEDNGCGMDQETANQAIDPFYTTKPSKRVGLGLPLLAQAAREADGELQIDTAPGRGSVIRASFRLSHPDIKPIGDMLKTMATLACTHPEVQFAFEHQRDGATVYQWKSGPAETVGR